MENFEALLSEHRNCVERLVRFKIGSPTDADDVLQETYLTAYRKFPQLKSADSFKPWIIQIAKNKCNDYFRQRAAGLEVPIDSLSERELSWNRSGETRAGAVQDTLDLLSERDRQILQLYFWNELPQTQIARRLGIPVGTVKSRLHTAKRNFKDKYPYRAEVMKGEISMKKLPDFIPEYKIIPSGEAPFEVRWEELWGLFIVPRLGEKLCWGAYDRVTRKRINSGEMSVVGKAEVHGVECVEISECRRNSAGEAEPDHRYFAQLTDTHSRMLAESYERGGVRKLMTFLDGDDFLTEWGYGEDNCGKEINLRASGRIAASGGGLAAENTDQLVDIVGRYTVSIAGREFDTVRVISLDSYCGEYIACEQYLDKDGRTVLWRRFNRDDWELDGCQKRWSEQLPDNERLTVNGQTYVHWYDCITDHIL